MRGTRTRDGAGPASPAQPPASLHPLYSFSASFQQDFLLPIGSLGPLCVVSSLWPTSFPFPSLTCSLPSLLLQFSSSFLPLPSLSHTPLLPSLRCPLLDFFFLLLIYYEGINFKRKQVSSAPYLCLGPNEQPVPVPAAGGPGSAAESVSIVSVGGAAPLKGACVDRPTVAPTATCCSAWPRRWLSLRVLD